MRKLFVFLFVAIAAQTLFAEKVATWIYYPGDFEIWLSNNVQNRRTARGAFFPPFWKVDSHYVLVEFSKKLDLAAPETVSLKVEGRYNVKLDGNMLFGFPDKVTIPAGKHSLNIKVFNQATVPSIYVNGPTIKSDGSWKVTYEDKEWIDESGKASDTSSGTLYLDAASWNFNSPDATPSTYKLATKPQPAVSHKQVGKGVLYDFGKETFGYPKFNGLKGKGTLSVYYGESPEEALSVDSCETLDHFTIDQPSAKDYTVDLSKAFRYVYVEKDNALSYDSLSMQYEYLPLEYKGTFRCNDPLINKMWDVGTYTLHLTTREFFIDGIKRDRWLWSGDAYQSYLMNYYSFFDPDAVSRTIFALRGKDPVTSHVNTIMDYTFYWFMSIYDYYQYTGNKKIIEQLYPRMKSLMDFCLSRRDADGMMEGKAGDWVFIDWADFKMSKAGQVSFEQLLFCRSLETMALCSNLLNNRQDADSYTKLATDLKAKLLPAFWSDKAGAFVHNRENGQQSAQVTPFTNMFAVLFGYLDKSKTEAVKQNVLLNPHALKITTPYMRFYELEALCALGEQKHVLKEMRDYWGGMIKLGATTFWEKYNPERTNQTAMYGRPFGNSFCHAWGASPIYLLGKYYLGVKPTSPGYKTYDIEPSLGDLQWMEGDVPTPNGKVHLYFNTKEIRVKADEGVGTLRFSSKSKPSCKEGPIVAKGGNKYELEIQAGKEYSVKYK
ncbi:alpha-L-rhamnosidase-related protein [Paludibacter jiangxiensis]|uniref:Alpha-L-rhamnosidase n=1 Tax=Paludibacter jiangxiensis TaxID=681398 RepID=A0A170Z0V6_9BACT|nr:alpha-L-rhamnosidase C-terminal domain-containing protein [Paludibacter jiangxiensis]GAT62241.1 alpha-L-rhamnosidase [Paludibacter jiangxiensis]